MPLPDQLLALIRRQMLETLEGTVQLLALFG